METFRAYRFRLFPSRAQSAKLAETFRICAILYNTALDQRRIYYKRGATITYQVQQDELPELRAQIPEFKTVHSQVMQDVLRRLDRAFANHYDRIQRKKGDRRVKAGHPRFKSVPNYSSITYPQEGNGWKILSNGHIRVSKFGEIRAFMHRPIRGIPKTLTLKRDKAGDWFAIIVCRIQVVVNAPVAARVYLGLDMGLKNLVATSAGDCIEAPKFYRRVESRLQSLQRVMDRKEVGSSNYARAKLRLAKACRKVRRRREDFLHKLSAAIVQRADVLIIEDLKPATLVKNRRLAKSILDASWGTLFRYTSYKAQSAGKTVELVPPRGTTTKCSRCGTTVPKSLSERIHKCPACGLVIDRDLNAAINIRNKVGGGTAEFKPAETKPLLLSKQVSAVMQEARGYPWEDVTLWTLES